MGNDQTTLRQHALLQACEHGDLDKVHQVMNMGADVELEHINWPGKTPLVLSTSSGHVEVVKALLDKYHALVNSKNDDGWTSLHYACWHGRLDIVKVLVEHEANVNSLTELDQTPLHFAARYNHVEIAEYLIEIDADPNRRDSQGNKPFHDAVFEGHARMTTFLEDHTTQDDDDYVREQEELMMQMDPEYASDFTGALIGSDENGNDLYFIMNEETQSSLIAGNVPGAVAVVGADGQVTDYSGPVGASANSVASFGPSSASIASFGVPANSKLAQIVVERNQDIAQLKQTLRISQTEKTEQEERFKAEIERMRREYEGKISELQKKVQSLQQEVTTHQVVTRSYAVGPGNVN